jgi:hypothetical protein
VRLFSLHGTRNTLFKNLVQEVSFIPAHFATSKHLQMKKDDGASHQMPRWILDLARKLFGFWQAWCWSDSRSVCGEDKNLCCRWGLNYAGDLRLYWLKELFKWIAQIMLLTPWSRVVLEKLRGSRLVKKFPAFYGARRFITAFTSARNQNNVSFMNNIIYAMIDNFQFSTQIPVGSTISHRVGLLKNF